MILYYNNTGDIKYITKSADKLYFDNTTFNFSVYEIDELTANQDLCIWLFNNYTKTNSDGLQRYYINGNSLLDDRKDEPGGWEEFFLG